jgi:broad specificity phosphatase PhoE
MRERQVSVLDAELHGGESLDTVAERVWEALEAALAAGEGPLVLVSHGYAIQALLRRLTAEPLPPSFIGNGDVVELWLEAGALAEPLKHYPLKAAHAAA